MKKIMRNIIILLCILIPSTGSSASCNEQYHLLQEKAAHISECTDVCAVIEPLKEYLNIMNETKNDGCLLILSSEKRREFNSYMFKFQNLLIRAVQECKSK
jgi:hypothetical protein